MDNDKLEHFRRTLACHRDSLLELLSADSPKKDVLLSGATVKDVLEVVSEFKDALERIDNGQFGRCSVCDGEVEIDRLELDCTTRVCIDHYSKAQIRNLERDLELAAKIQQRLSSCCAPALSNIQFAFHTQPAHMVGGDYLDFFCSPGSVQGLAIADVMGKGIPASMLMSNLQASLRILGQENTSLPILARRLNELFRYNLKLISFVSLFLARIDGDEQTLQYCNAGHIPQLYWDAASRSIHRLNPTGPAIGLVHDAEYESKTVRFGSDDLFLLYTDGLVEVRDGKGEEYGEMRLVSYVKDNAHKSADDFLTDLRKTAEDFAGGFQDDVALLVIKIL